MALINCKECNKEISDKALTCPNCGNPIVPIQSGVQPKIIVKKSEGCFLQTLNVGCLFIFITILIGCLLYLGMFFSKKQDNAQKHEEQKVENKK